MLHALYEYKAYAFNIGNNTQEKFEFQTFQSNYILHIMVNFLGTVRI